VAGQNRLLIKSEFGKSAFTLTTGTGISQIFPILFYPILARIYAPAEFGIFATLASITTILIVLSTGNYENSILIVRTRKDAANVVGLVLFLSSLLLFISFILLEVLSNQISIWFNEPELGKWLFICPLSALAIIIFNCYKEWCVRNKYFGDLAWNKVFNSSATSLSKLFFGFVKIAGNGLVVGDLIGRIISAGVCIARTSKKDRSDFSSISFRRMRHLANENSRFPKFTLPAQVINTIGGSIPVLFIGAYFNSDEAGYYAMTMYVLSVPISVISLAIKDVFRQRANEDYLKTGNCMKIFEKLLKILTLGSISGSVIIFFILPGLYSILLGERWRIAGEYSQILLPMFAINFVYTSLSGVLIITNKMKEIMYLEVYYTVITIISLLLGWFFFHNMKAVLIFYAIGRSTSYLLSIVYSYRFSKGK